MITCIIRYEIDPYKRAAFEEYARNWGRVIPRCGADLIGYFAPHEGTTTTAYGIYSIADLAAYGAYRARIKADPLGKENYALSQREQFTAARTGSSSHWPRRARHRRVHGRGKYAHDQRKARDLP